MTTQTGRTKSGATIQIAVVSESDLPEGIEARTYRAAEMAQQAGCSHYRIISSTGAVVALGRAAQPMLSTAEASRRSGPTGW